MISTSINVLIKKKKYTIDKHHLIELLKNNNIEQSQDIVIINVLLHDLPIDKQDVNIGLLINYMNSIKTSVIKRMNIPPSKKIKLTRSAKELMASICLQHVYKIISLIESCNPFIYEKIIQLRTIKIIYSTWMTLGGALKDDIMKFHDIVDQKLC